MFAVVDRGDFQTVRYVLRHRRADLVIRLFLGAMFFSLSVFNFGFDNLPSPCEARGDDARPVEADIVLRGGAIHDGSGGEPSVGDVAIRSDRIVAVGKFATSGSPRVIDVAGLIVAPGFIDLHSHSDNPILDKSTRPNLNFLRQGVTSVVTGNCGSGHVDVGQYMRKLDEHPAGTNVLHLIPHGSLRREVVGEDDRPATEAEMDRMRELVARGMNDGAWGMATGLIYTPGSYADTAELIELSKVVAERRGIYVSHMRNENTRLLESIDETLRIGREAGLPVHISHFKATGQDAWGLAAPAIERIEAARESGQRVTADQYPYEASSTSLAAMVIPAKMRAGDKWREALADPAKQPAFGDAIADDLRRRGGGSTLFVAGYAKRREWQGKDLETIAKEQGCSVVDLVIEIETSGGASMVNFGMKEEEVRLIMQQPWVATASDGSAKVPTADDVPHPRSYGCFPRKIGRYAIANKTVPLAQSIRSASGLPADILGLADRGYVRAGQFADIVVFDPETFRDVATYDQPHQYATGVRYLFVNGHAAIDNETASEELAGRAVRRPRS